MQNIWKHRATGVKYPQLTPWRWEIVFCLWDIFPWPWVVPLLSVRCAWQVRENDGLVQHQKRYFNFIFYLFIFFGQQCRVWNKGEISNAERPGMTIKEYHKICTLWMRQTAYWQESEGSRLKFGWVSLELLHEPHLTNVMTSRDHHTLFVNSRYQFGAHGRE